MNKLRRIYVSFTKGAQHLWIEEDESFEAGNHYFSAYGEFYSAEDQKPHANLKARLLINMNNVQWIESLTDVEAFQGQSAPLEEDKK